MTRFALLSIAACLVMGVAAPSGSVAAPGEEDLVAHVAKKCKKKKAKKKKAKAEKAKKKRHRKCRKRTAPSTPSAPSAPAPSRFHVPTREEALAAMFRDMVSYFNQYVLNTSSPGDWWAEIQDGGPVDVPGLTGTTRDTCYWIPWSGTRSLHCQVIYWRKNAVECNFYGAYGRQWTEEDWLYTTRPIYAGAAEMTTDLPDFGNEYLCVL